MSLEWNDVIMSYHDIQLTELCFYPCFWFCSQGEVCLSTCWDITPHPGSRHPPGSRDPSRSRHPPDADTPAYGQWADSTHPTGMHSCSECFLTNMTAVFKIASRSPSRFRSPSMWMNCEALRERFADASGELPVVNHPWVTSFIHMYNTKVQEKSISIWRWDLVTLCWSAVTCN